MKWDWSSSFKIEMAIQKVMSEQAHYGVYFNQQKAEDLVFELTFAMNCIEDEILPLFHLELEIFGVLNKPFMKDGDYSKYVKIWYLHDASEYSKVWGPFTRVDFLPLTFSKRARVMDQLIEMGWKPKWYTDKGNPQISRDGEICPNISKISGEVGKYLPLWYNYAHRRSQINGWLENLRDDSRLSASAIVCGTNTGRMTHRVVVNVPKAADYVVYGREMRELFCVPKNKKLLGVDAAGLELRMLCHYMNDSDYTERLLNEDIHTYNQRLAGLPNRDAAKTFIYALIYGAGNGKLGSIVGGTHREGKRIRDRFIKGLPALGTLTDRVERASSRGFLKGLDGRKVWMRKDPNGHVATHKGLNTLLQSGGSIVMKMAAIIADKAVKDRKLDAHQVLNFHDEYQYEVGDEDVEEVKEILEDSIRMAGEMFNLRIPLEGECKIGNDWSMTH